MTETPFAHDPIVNVIHRGLKRDIDVAWDNGCTRATIVLIYVAIDIMASLDAPSCRVGVVKSDFVAWCERYLTFPGKERLSGLELYSARCAVVHTYTTESDLTRSGGIRRIGYVDQSPLAITYDHVQMPDMAFLSIHALKDALFAGIDRFLVAAFADKTKAPLLEERLKPLLHEFDFPNRPKRTT